MCSGEPKSDVVETSKQKEPPSVSALRALQVTRSPPPPTSSVLPSPGPRTITRSLIVSSLPLLVPSVVSLLGRRNWWPSRLAGERPEAPALAAD